MEKVYLTRHNLLTLLSKLDRRKAGQQTTCTLIKQDTVHSKFPCSSVIEVIGVEDEEYYTDRVAGKIHPSDATRIGDGK